MFTCCHLPFTYTGTGNNLQLWNGMCVCGSILCPILWILIYPKTQAFFFTLTFKNIYTCRDTLFFMVCYITRHIQCIFQLIKATFQQLISWSWTSKELQMCKTQQGTVLAWNNICQCCCQLCLAVRKKTVSIPPAARVGSPLAARSCPSQHKHHPVINDSASRSSMD